MVRNHLMLRKQGEAHLEMQEIRCVEPICFSVEVFEANVAGARESV